MSRSSIRLASALLALPVCIIVGTAPACNTSTKKAGGPLAVVTYYSDAEGAFDLAPPPLTTGAILRLSGTSSFPELQLSARNKRLNGPVRQAAHRLNGKKVFDLSYFLKDGPGDYEVTLFGKRAVGGLELRGLCSFRVTCVGDTSKNMDIPDINDRILSFVNSVMGTTVGRGECWDLAQEALDAAGADWNRPFNFGTLLDPDKDRVKPGDIIQFKTVKIVEVKPDGGMRWEVLGAPDHTAVILSVRGKKEYTLAHQNIGGKRSVMSSAVNLNLATSGKYWIYRPAAGIIK
jgi:hypothetical protein